MISGKSTQNSFGGNLKKVDKIWISKIIGEEASVITKKTKENLVENIEFLSLV